jgi:hypothetical protein
LNDDGTVRHESTLNIHAALVLSLQLARRVSAT